MHLVGNINGMKDGKMLWHYTIRLFLDSILTDGVLKPATLGVPKGELPVVWFSANPFWEKTANKGSEDELGIRLTLSMWETHEIGKGLVRIGVDPSTAPYRWEDFKRLSGIAAKTAKDLYRKAIEIQARPGEWYVSFEPVPMEKWVAIEVFDGLQWAPLEVLTGQTRDR